MLPFRRWPSICVGGVSSPRTWPHPFWVRRVGLCRLFMVTTFIGNSHLFTLSFHPGSPPPCEADRIDLLSRVSLLTIWSGVTLSRTLRTPPFLHGARGGRILLAEQQVNSTTATVLRCVFTKICATSRRTLTPMLSGVGPALTKSNRPWCYRKPLKRGVCSMFNAGFTSVAACC